MPIIAEKYFIGLDFNGESVEIALLGATVYSYKSKGIERLFKSTKSSIEGPSAIRGGVPVCFPVFGPPPNHLSKFLKQHGFARTSAWTFDQLASTDSKDGIAAVFTLASTPSTLEAFPSAFNLTYTVHLTSNNLSMSLKVDSPASSNSTLSFQALLHSYIHLPTSVLPKDVTVTPLGGLTFVDKVKGGARGKEGRAVVDVDGPKGEVDRVYLNAPSNLEVNFGGAGRMNLSKSGLSDVVLWNPGEEKAANIGDMEEGGAKRFICLEPGQVGDFVDLNAGESWEGSMILSFSD